MSYLKIPGFGVAAFPGFETGKYIASSILPSNPKLGLGTGGGGGG